MLTPDPRQRCLSALVVYEYELLGEGIATLLRHEGVETTVVRASDTEKVTAALASGPCLVIAERATAECHDRIRRLCPRARLIDVSRVIGRGFPQAEDQFGFAVIQDALASLRAPVG